MSDWDRYASYAYEMLIASESGNQDNSATGAGDDDEDEEDEEEDDSSEVEDKNVKIADGAVEVAAVEDAEKTAEPAAVELPAAE